MRPPTGWNRKGSGSRESCQLVEQAAVPVVDRVVVAVLAEAGGAAAVVVLVAGVVVAVVVASVVPRVPSRSCRFVAVRASSREAVGSAFRLLSSSATRTAELAGDTGRRPRSRWRSRRLSRTRIGT